MDPRNDEEDNDTIWVVERRGKKTRECWNTHVMVMELWSQGKEFELNMVLDIFADDAVSSSGVDLASRLLTSTCLVGSIATFCPSLEWMVIT